LATSALIILFSEMLKFLIKEFEQKAFVKEKRKSKRKYYIF
jgi:hypothetical protein